LRGNSTYSTSATIAAVVMTSKTIEKPYVRPVLRGPDETALAGLGANVPEPFLKKHSVERRITMPGQSGKTV
jgi:hypothetical protein